jgi:hypothetical protein
VRSLESLGMRPDGVLAQLLSSVTSVAEIFYVEVGGERIPFNGPKSYSKLNDLWEKANEFETLLRKGMVPAVKPELIPARTGDASQAQFLASLCAEPELQEPLPWLIMQAEEGLLFKYFVDEVDKEISLKVRNDEKSVIEQKKARSKRTRRSAPAST